MCRLYYNKTSKVHVLVCKNKGNSLPAKRRMLQSTAVFSVSTVSYCPCCIQTLNLRLMAAKNTYIFFSTTGLPHYIAIFGVHRKIPCYK